MDWAGRLARGLGIGAQGAEPADMSTADSLSLNGTWDVAWSDDFPTFLTAERLPGRHVFPAAVPAPIHQALLDAGYLDDPRVGMNALRAR